MSYDAVLFDLDGTLTDPKPGITRSVQYALRRVGIQEDHLDRLVGFIGPPLLASFRSYGLEGRAARNAVDAYREYFRDRGLYENRVYPGIPELLQRLTERSVRLVVTTAKPTVFAEQVLQHIGLRPHFHSVVGANLDHTRTEKAEIIKDALALLPTARRAIVVGDREHDVLGARANGLEVVAVSYGYGSLEELRRAGAARVAASVSELGEYLLA